jgi:DNA-directed RNA polymerase specialized sigma24 family protein
MGIKSDWYLLDDREKAIQTLRERIENLLTIATHTTRGYESNGSRKIGGTKDKNADIVLKIMELEDELAELNHDRHCQSVWLKLHIAQVERDKRKVFIDRYLRNMSLTETAKANGTTKKTICQTLKKFEQN